MKDLPFVVHRDDVAGEDGRYPAPFDAELLSHGRNLGEAAGSEAIGVWHETLAPGRRTSRTHAHLYEEEAIYVLSGTPTLRIVRTGVAAPEAVTDQELRAGHFVSFPAGTGIAHSLVNHGDEPVELLVIGGRHAGERCRYPEDPELEAWRAVNRPLRQWPEEAVPAEGNGAQASARRTPYVVRTPRLVLTPWSPEEAPGLCDRLTKEHARLTAFGAPGQAPKSLEAVAADMRAWRAAFDRDEGWVYAARYRGRPIGGVALHRRVGPAGVEIGGWVAQEHEGSGLAIEALQAVAKVALGPLAFERVEVWIPDDNVRAIAAASAAGLRPDGTLRRRLRGRDLRVFSLFPDEVATSPLAALDVRAWDATGRRVL